MMAGDPKEKINPERIIADSIRAWRELVVPHTPPESDVYRSSPPKDVAGTVILLLSQLTRDIGNYTTLIRHVKGLVAIWPTVWIWIRMLCGRVGEASGTLPTLAARKATHTVLVQAVLFFLGHVRPGIGLRPPDSTLKQLSTLVKKTPGVLEMISRFWIEEAKIKKANMGFSV